ncbi:hypothetical protein G4B84_005694 [Aspergillus flavus NRRL3357]|nr:uncharacterized protein G4B84_005694 [Aspergillus flavus NRRL3357]QMW30359.1 hypothetical protein G4B84_005694 [Aspergillus flavus NRRL3357]QMW42431.1 hypothetical protein G4B11_005755 [Aspergillus flavus]
MDLTTQRKVVFGRIADIRYEGSGTGLSRRSSLLGQPDGSNLNSQLPRQWSNVANETGGTGRLVAHVFQEIAPVLHRHGVDMVFADVQGANAPRLPPKEKVFPGFVLHSPTGEVRLVGEMKTSWTTDLDNLWSRAERKFLGQVFRYMDDYGTLYGCACTYEQAVFLKRRDQGPFRSHRLSSIALPRIKIGGIAGYWARFEGYILWVLQKAIGWVITLDWRYFFDSSLTALASGCQALSTRPYVPRGHSLSRRDDSAPIYRDASYCIDERVDDLLARMTIEEKAGQLFHTRLMDGPLDDEGSGNNAHNSTSNMIGEKHMTHFNLASDITNATETAEFINRIQELALQTRLGIPVTVSTDPRHSFTENVGTGFKAGVFSQWPESIGLAALRDPYVVRKFAEVAKEEYIAVGIRAALHPQVDLSTEPRWARISNTWGENSTLTSELLVEYIKGFQGDKLGPQSVKTVTKHFPGGGPVENGEDSHFAYGKNQTYPGNNLEEHLKPFKAAIAAGATEIMPYYSRPIGTEYEPVAFSFNKRIVTELLRNELGFEGIVLTDWGLITDGYIAGQYMPARAWGVENLTELERAARILDAGCDQFGGEERPELIVQLVQEGTVSEDRIDVSVRRLLREKFVLGLFDNPFVDPESAGRVVGNDYFVRLGREAQRRSYTLLSNNEDIVPLKKIEQSTKFYIEGFNASFIESWNYTVVDSPEEADYALLRYNAPYEPRPGGFEANMHAGSLAFNDTEKARQAKIYSTVPTIVDIVMDRPAVIPEIIEQAKAVFASYGSDSNAFLDVVFGVSAPEGKLPFDLPSSMEAVEAQMEDVPFDTRNPVFKFGHGLSYANPCASSSSKCS